MATEARLQLEPKAESPVTDDVAAGTDVSVLGGFGDFLFVRVGEGRAGWMPATLQED